MIDTHSTWNSNITELPLVAILRGIHPDEALDVGHALIDEGFRVIEVPLNSPTPYQTIESLARNFGDTISVGAGTVLDPDQVKSTVDAGGTLIVAPNFNPAVAEATERAQAVYCPGIATPSEAFAALEMGADALKLFPAEMIGPAVVKAMRAVLPDTVRLLPVGGINPRNMPAFLSAGANGFGIGSALYKPGKNSDAVRLAAKEFVQACRGELLE